MYEDRSFFNDASTEMWRDFVLFPVYAVFCLMSSRPRLKFVVN